MIHDLQPWWDGGENQKAKEHPTSTYHIMISWIPIWPSTNLSANLWLYHLAMVLITAQMECVISFYFDESLSWQMVNSFYSSKWLLLWKMVTNTVAFSFLFNHDIYIAKMQDIGNEDAKQSYIVWRNNGAKLLWSPVFLWDPMCLCWFLRGNLAKCHLCVLNKLKACFGYRQNYCKKHNIFISRILFEGIIIYLYLNFHAMIYDWLFYFAGDREEREPFPS